MFWKEITLLKQNYDHFSFLRYISDINRQECELSDIFVNEFLLIKDILTGDEANKDLFEVKKEH